MAIFRNSGQVCVAASRLIIEDSIHDDFIKSVIENAEELQANAPADGYTIGSFVIGVPVLGHQIGIEELAPAKFDPLGIFVTSGVPPQGAPVKSIIKSVPALLVTCI